MVFYRTLASFLVVIYYCMLVVTCLTTSLYYSYDITPHFIFFSVVLLLTGIAIGFSCYQLNLIKSIKRYLKLTKDDIKSLILLCLLVVSCGCAYFINIDLVSLNRDEIKQWGGVTGWMANPVQSSIVEMQVPLSYFFTALGGFIPASADIKVRFFSFFFTCLAVVNFWIILSFEKIKPYWRIFLLSGLLFNPWIVRFAQEGRPYAISICLLSLALLTHITLDDDGPSVWMKLASYTLYVLSINIQPMAVLIFP